MSAWDIDIVAKLLDELVGQFRMRNIRHFILSDGPREGHIEIRTSDLHVQLWVYGCSTQAPKDVYHTDQKSTSIKNGSFYTLLWALNVIYVAFSIWALLKASVAL